MLAFHREPRHSSAPSATVVEHDLSRPTTPDLIFPERMAKIPTPRVLVVDEEALLRWSLAETLAAAGYEVVAAGDGADARRALIDGKGLAAMLVDLRLPDTDGLTLIDEAHQRGINCPVVLMTAYGTVDTLRAASGRGALRVVVKPFDLDDMVRVIQQLCPLPVE
jgi:DNA-binding NtrC family response regulator